MGWESSGVVGFDLGPLQGQTRIAKVKSAYNSLIIDPRNLQYETNSTKSWARNFLMLDLTLGPSFKVKQWITGFGELSFWWIQICIGLRCVGLVKDGNRDIFFLSTLEFQYKHSHGHLEVKMRGFSSQLTYCSIHHFNLTH